MAGRSSSAIPLTALNVIAPAESSQQHRQPSMTSQFKRKDDHA
jgi:hypothetical protein